MVDTTGTSILLTDDHSSVTDFHVTRLVVAGYTGRDRAAVDAHIKELAAAGIPAPARVPSYFELAPTLAQTSEAVEVSSLRTSGEAEAVLLITDAGPVFAVGSDHTDRDLERRDVHASKAACPKVISSAVLPYDLVIQSWDDCTLRSWAGSEPYQEGPLRGITPAESLLDDFGTVMGPPAPGLVLFLGTIPLVDGDFSFTDSYRVSLSTPEGHSIESSYRVVRRT